jgi:HSP20 family protein
MQNNLFYTTRPSIYPGEYVPRYEENIFNKIVRYRYKKKTTDLPLNIHESGNFYRIELAIPGVERENLFVKICENVLSVSVSHKNDEPDEQRKFQLHEFTFDGGFSCNIMLPDNADPVFISAENRSGILQLHIPKSKRPVKRIDTKIAVY